MTDCRCFHNSETSYFEPCCEAHEWEYVAHLERVAYLNHGVCVFCCVRPCRCPDWYECHGCPELIDSGRLCSECDWKEKNDEWDRGPQTLADVGMCEADFR